MMRECVHRGAIVVDSVVHVFFYRGRVDVSFQVASHLRSWWRSIHERRLALGTFAAYLAVHWKTSPLAHGRWVSSLASFQELNGGLVVEAFVVVIVELEHWGIGTSSQTLNLQQRKQAVLRCAPILDVQMVHDGLFDVLGPANHAWGRAAQLNEVLSSLLAVEHGVECRNLVHADRGHSYDFCDLVHRCEWKPASGLALRQIKEWNDASLFVVAGVLSQYSVDPLIVLLGEIEVRDCVVVLCEAVLGHTATHMLGCLVK